MRYRTGEEPSARSVHLLLSYAIRYPDISTVRYDPTGQTLRLSFLVKGAIAADEFQRARRKLQETLEVYHMMGHRSAQVIQMVREELGDFNSITLERDVASLTPEELYTVVEVMRELFSGRLIAEPIEFFGEEELVVQDEIIEEVLSSLSQQRSGTNLIAIREDGRLMIFQK